MIPLQLHLLAHPDSKPSRRLAEALMDRFMDPPATGGLRVPVWLTPDRGDGLPPDWDRDVQLDAAEHTVVVVLSDSVMTQTVAGGKGKQWKEFLDEGVRRAPVGVSPHYVFGVAVGADGFRLEDKRHMLHVDEPPWEDDDQQADTDYDRRIGKWLGSQIDDLALQITLRAIQLLDPRVVAAPDKKPLRLFLSHAKADLSDDADDPLRAVQQAIRDLRVSGWFDAAEIPPSTEFADEIEQGLRDCSIVVAFLTDEYATRTWCQREVLDAKRFGVPILVVVALEDGEARNFPYLGNLPTLCSRGDDIPALAKRIVCRAGRETLRAMHNRAVVTEYADEGEEALAAAPEAATLAWKNATRFIYPDPPLSRQELELLHRLRPDAKFSTPLMKIVERGVPQGLTRIAVSISNSGELERRGLTARHERTLPEEVHLYLLMAGLQIAYGGALNGDFSKSGNNFTTMLFELVRSYAGLARQLGGDLKPIANYAPWPLRLGYGRRELRLFGETAELIEGPAPPESEIPERPEDLFPKPAQDGGFRFKSDSPEQRLAWTRGLTAMRAEVTRNTDARLAIGGKLARYSGVYPGIVEEAWMSLVTGQPLYLVGAFGGAASAVIEALEGDGSRLSDVMRNTTGATETIRVAADRGIQIDQTVQWPRTDPNPPGRLLHPEAMAREIFARHEPGPAAALNNGLTDDENRELFHGAHPPLIAELVLTGLSRLHIHS